MVSNHIRKAIVVAKRFRPDHWAWMHAKVALLVWAILFLAFTPTKVSAALDIILASSISFTTIIGVVISIVGLFQAMSLNIEKAKRGTNLELAGLWVALIGPVSYFATQFFLSFGPDGDQRIALTAFAYAVSSFVYVRIVLILEHRKRPRV